jgi:hypothetical protein
MKFQTINCIKHESLNQLKTDLHQKNYRLFELNGEEIHDTGSLFQQIAASFPQDPPLSGNCNWDALTDSLFGGLDQLGEARVAFIWTHSDNMLHSGLDDLLTAVICFDQVASLVATTEASLSEPVNLLVFLIGKGANFKAFEITSDV